MAIAILLESRFAVNPFRKQVEVDKKPEIIEDVNFELSDKINFIFEEYKKMHSRFQDHKNCCVYMSYHMESLKFEVLLPNEIELLMQLITVKTSIENDGDHKAGIMISRLINDSYNAGNNNFNITTNDWSICLRNLKGKTEKNPVSVSVFGNVGQGFGYRSKYCIFDIKGNAGMHLGIESKHCNYAILESVDRLCGVQSENCTYNVNGNAAEEVGFASEGCNYNITGKIESPISKSIKNSTFKVLDRDNYNLLVQKLPKTNAIYLVDNAGRIIMETKK